MFGAFDCSRLRDRAWYMYEQPPSTTAPARCALTAIPLHRESTFRLSRTENPEMIFAAANHGVCADLAWAILALEEREAHDL